MRNNRSKKVSIVIPSARPEMAKATLNSVIKQMESYHYEVIVVGKNVSTLKNNFPEVIFVDNGVSYTPSEARNLGANQATGKTIIFIDDDCEALPGWLKNYLRYLDNEKIGAATGMIIGKSNKFFARCTDYACFYLQQQTVEKEIDRMSSATFAMRRDVFKKVGGFDNNIVVREDLDLARRLRKQGWKIVYFPDVAILHNHKRDTLLKLIKYQYNSGVLAGLFVPFKHKDGWKDCIKIYLKDYYILLILPSAIWSTFKAIIGILRFKKDIIQYIPFIFISNLSYQLGVLKWIISSRK